MKLSENLKLDIGLVAQALNNGNATGEYFDMSKYKKALVLLNGGAMAAGKTTKVELLQAQDVDGNGAKAIANASAIITANALVTKATITLATFVAGGKITINGLVFTAHADTTTLANREFAIDGDDTADAAELVKCINDETYGVPGVTASSALGVVTLVATDPGETVITISDDVGDATITLATVEAQSYVEIDVADLDVANDFTHIAAKVTTTADSVVSVSLLRGDGRWTPDQKVGASAVL